MASSDEEEAREKAREEAKKKGEEVPEDEVDWEAERAEWNRFKQRALQVLSPLRPLLDAMEGGPRYYWSVLPEDIPGAIVQLEELLPVAKSKLGSHLVTKGMIHGERSLISRWKTLLRLSKRLHSLASQQLQGVPFDKSDNNFIRSYGMPLGEVMFYDGNSWLSPRDDAPRAVPVFNGGDGRLLAAVGRARAIYVLYPGKGRSTLCRGAVMPYYEFRNPEPLTDSEWKIKLDAEPRPELPEFTSSLYAGKPAKAGKAGAGSKEREGE